MILQIFVYIISDTKKHNDEIILCVRKKTMQNYDERNRNFNDGSDKFISWLF